MEGFIHSRSQWQHRWCWWSTQALSLEQNENRKFRGKAWLYLWASAAQAAHRSRVAEIAGELSVKQNMSSDISV